MPTDFGMPLPGETVASSKVVASVIACDPEVGECKQFEFEVILLNDAPPYYTVATITKEDPSAAEWTFLGQENHPNIVPAVRAYEQNGGDY